MDVSQFVLSNRTSLIVMVDSTRHTKSSIMHLSNGRFLLLSFPIRTLNAVDTTASSGYNCSVAEDWVLNPGSRHRSVGQPISNNRPLWQLEFASM